MSWMATDLRTPCSICTQDPFDHPTLSPSPNPIQEVVQFDGALRLPLFQCLLLAATLRFGLPRREGRGGEEGGLVGLVDALGHGEEVAVEDVDAAVVPVHVPVRQQLPPDRLLRHPTLPTLASFAPFPLSL